MKKKTKNYRNKLIFSSLFIISASVFGGIVFSIGQNNKKNQNSDDQTLKFNPVSSKFQKQFNEVSSNISYLSSTTPAFSINNATILAPQSITITKNQYSSIQELIWNNYQIQAYDPAWGFITSLITTENTSNLDFKVANTYNVTLSTKGSNGQKVTKSLEIKVVESSDSSQANVTSTHQGDYYPYVVTQNATMYQNDKVANIFSKDWQLLTSKQFKNDQTVKITQTNTNFNTSLLKDQKIKFLISNGDLSTATIQEWNADSELTLTIPNTPTNNNFVILVQTPVITNLAIESWPIFHYNTEANNSVSKPSEAQPGSKPQPTTSSSPKTEGDTATAPSAPKSEKNTDPAPSSNPSIDQPKAIPFLQLLDNSYTKDAKLKVEINNHNNKQAVAFWEYWQNNSDIEQAIISDNSGLFHLTKNDFENIKTKGINSLIEIIKNNQDTLYKYQKLIGMNIDDINNDKNSWWNTPIAIRPYVTLSSKGLNKKYAIISSNQGILDILNQQKNWIMQLGNIFPNPYPKNEQENLVNIINSIYATSIELNNAEWSKLSNDTLMNAYEKIVAKNINWNKGLIELNQLIHDSANNDYSSIVDSNPLKVLPIFQILRKTDFNLWTDAMSLMREYYGFVLADPTKTNPELFSNLTQDEDITIKKSEIALERKKTWSNKYPALASNPNFWDFLNFVAIQTYKKDFGPVLALLGIKVSDAISEYAYQSNAATIFRLQDIVKDSDINDILAKNLANITSPLDWVTIKETQWLGSKSQNGNLEINVLIPNKDIINPQATNFIKLYKENKLIYTLPYSEDNKYKINGLEPGEYTLVFSQYFSKNQSQILNKATVIIKSGTDANYTFQYSSINQNDIFNKSIHLFVKNSKNFSTNVSYNPNNQVLNLNSEFENIDIDNSQQLYGYVLRDKSTTLYKDEATKEIDEHNVYYFAKLDDTNLTKNLQNLKLDPVKLANNDYELWLLYNDQISSLKWQNHWTDTIENVASQNTTTVTNDFIKDINTTNYKMVKVRIDLQKGLQIIPNPTFDIDDDKNPSSSSSLTSSNIDRNFNTSVEKGIMDQITKITNDFNDKFPNLSQVSEFKLNILVNKLNILLHILPASALANSSNAAAIKAARDLINKINNFETITIKEIEPLQVEKNQEFSPFSNLQIISSQKGYLSPNIAKIISTDIRVNSDGKYYVPAKGTYTFKFQVKTDNASVEYTRQIVGVDEKPLKTKKSNFITDKIADKNYFSPFLGSDKILELNTYEKNQLYKTINQIRPIVLDNGYITTYNTDIQFRGFDGDIISSINIQNYGLDNFEKILYDANTQKLYALISHEKNGSITQTKILEIDFDFNIGNRLRVKNVFDGLGNINNFAILNDRNEERAINKILLWNTANSTAELNKKNQIYSLDLTKNKIDFFYLKDKIFNQENYITNIIPLNNSYNYTSFDFDKETKKAKSLELMNFSFDKTYLVTMINAQGQMYYVVVDNNFNNVTKPRIVPRQNQAKDFTTNVATIDDFILEPTSEILGSSKYLDNSLSNFAQVKALYASQNIYNVEDKKFVFSDQPFYYGNNKDKNISQNIFDINYSANEEYVYNKQTKKFTKAKNNWISKTDSLSDFEKLLNIDSTKTPKKMAVTDIALIKNDLMLTLPVYQDLKDYQDSNYAKELDENNYKIFVIDQSPTSNKILSFSYKDLVNNANLNNLVAKLIKVDETHFILSFLNSQTQIGITWNNDKKEIKFEKLLVNNFEINETSLSNLLKEYVPSSIAQEILDETKKTFLTLLNNNSINVTDIDYSSNNELGQILYNIRYEKRDWISQDTLNLNKIVVLGNLLSVNDLQLTPNSSLSLIDFKNHFPTTLTNSDIYDALIKSSSLNMNQKILKNLSLDFDDNQGILKLDIKLAELNLNQSKSYNGLLKRNDDMFWNVNKLPMIKKAIKAFSGDDEVNKKLDLQLISSLITFFEPNNIKKNSENITFSYENQQLSVSVTFTDKDEVSKTYQTVFNLQNVKEDEVLINSILVDPNIGNYIGQLGIVINLENYDFVNLISNINSINSITLQIENTKNPEDVRTITLPTFQKTNQFLFKQLPKGETYKIKQVTIAGKKMPLTHNQTIQKFQSFDSTNPDAIIEPLSSRSIVFPLWAIIVLVMAGLLIVPLISIVVFKLIWSARR